ncbi:unnamed protein product, partial [Mesorhabditis belari]|uniref:PAX-interacting protein 1 n=1 Tax=Mesorhabditis belari TaxID=2138241 RepID=A0AAF3FCZ8_9BILA
MSWFHEDAFDASSISYEVELPEQGLLETIIYRNYPPWHLEIDLLPTRTSIIRSIRPIEKSTSNLYQGMKESEESEKKTNQPVEIISYRRVDGEEGKVRENGGKAPRRHRIATHQLPIVIPPKIRVARDIREIRVQNCKLSRDSPTSLLSSISSTPSPQMIDTDLLIPSPDRLTIFPNVPQTPQTPNAHPYTPNGRGFVGTTPSPHHFPTGDMRSPLMSPPQATISRPLSSADMTMNPQIRLPGPIPPQFTVRDPNINIPPDLCFVGCCIQMVDSDKYTTDKSDMQNIANTIKLLGGDVDFGMKSFNEKLNVITHVVIDTARPSNQQMETILYQQAIPLKRRIVSMQWLVDAIAQKRMDVPWKAAHLPTFWRDIQRPHVGKVFAFAGFEPEERISLKFMVESIGGRATPYLSSQHSLLIAKTDSGGKVEKAREWNIPIVNYNWLQDVYFGKNNNVDLPQYQLGAPCSEVNTTGYALDALGDFNKNFLLGWRYPLLFDQQIFQRAQTVKHELEKDANVFPNMRYKEMFKNAPTEEQVDEAIARRKNNDQLDRRFVPRFSIAGFDDDLALAMSMKIRYLGGVMVVDVAKCTHFVTLNGKRTLSLLKAISVGAFVVRPEYIAASYEARCWQDSINFMMKDDESERLYGFNLKTSILKARRRKVFEKIRFFITPSVDPARLVLKRMIEVAGGEVDDEKPDVEEVMKRVDLDEPYIVIGAEADLRLVFYLLECNIPVYSPELILQSLVRQEFDASPSLRVIYPRSVPPVPQSSTSSQSTNQFQRPPPPTSATPQQPQTTTISNLPQRPSQSAHMTAAPVRG